MNEDWIIEHCDPAVPVQYTGSDWGGTWIVPQLLTNSCGSPYVISAGIGRDMSFDIVLVRQHNCRVLGIDPTAEALQTFRKARQTLGDLAYRVTLLRKALAAESGRNVTLGGPARTALSPKGEAAVTVGFNDLLEACGPVDLLKLDIEGSEFPVLFSVLENPESFLNSGIKQIVIGFHHWLNGETDRYKNPGVTNPWTSEHVEELLKGFGAMGYRTVFKAAESLGRFPQEALLIKEAS